MANENNKIKLLLLWDILSKNTGSAFFVVICFCMHYRCQPNHCQMGILSDCRILSENAGKCRRKFESVAIINEQRKKLKILQIKSVI